MSASVLISGHLWRDPQRKVSAAGKPYAVASVRVADGEASQWWHVAVFADEAIEALLRLSKGDALAASGPMQAEIFQATSGPRISLSMIAHRVISARPVKREHEMQRKAFGAPRPFDGRLFDFDDEAVSLTPAYQSRNLRR